MSRNCIAVEELGRVAELPAGHPERAHLDGCERCQSLLVMLRGFEHGTLRHEDAHFEAADGRLRALIAELAHGAPDDAAQPSAPRAVAGRERWWHRLFVPPAPRLRLALAVGALAVVSVVAVSTWRARGPDEHLRAVPPPGPGRVVASAPARERPGAVELRWQAFPGATRYRVVFLDESLRELARLEPVTRLSLELEAGALPPGLVHGATVGWQVEALAGEDRLAVSPARALRVP